jgi:hypothetical protein
MVALVGTVAFCLLAFGYTAASRSEPAATGSEAAASASRPVAPSSARLLFGMGDEISSAVTNPTTTEFPVNMVTSWYNGPSDLSWMSGYANSPTIRQLYADGKSLELVVWLADEPQYAISPQFQQDIQTLTHIFEGRGQLYIVLFTEFETYSSQPSYFVALRSAYLQAVNGIHSVDPQAKVALGFGGYDWSAASPTRNLAFWLPAIQASNFLAFQAMQADTSVVDGQSILVPEIEDAVRQLSQYHKPVMISHFEVWGTGPETCQVFSSVAQTLLRPPELTKLEREGLFAWGFMDDDYINLTTRSCDVYPLLRKAAGPSVVGEPLSALTS